MRFPSINRNGDYKTTVPNLRGGINLSAELSGIEDNQMSESKNLIFRDGLLRTRPGIELYQKGTAHEQDFILVSDDMYFPIGDGDHYTVFAEVYPNALNPTTKTDVVLHFTNADLFTTAHYSHTVTIGGQPSGVNIFEGKENEVFILGETSADLIKVYYDTENASFAHSDETAYVPKVYKSAYTKANSNYDCGIEGQIFEERNMLTPSYSMTYTMLNPAVATEIATNIYGHYMLYGLPYRMEKDTTLTVTVRKEGNTVTHSVKWTGEGQGSQADYDFQYEDGYNATDHLRLGVNGKTFVFDYNGSGSQVRYIVEDNTGSPAYYCNTEFECMEVSAVYEGSINDVSGASFSEWYGGAAYGVSGGSRLFVGGNAKVPNKIMWSAANNPLYYPENNYTYVGNAASPVTAFAKQGSLLAVFKRDALFISKYNEGSYNEGSQGVEANIAIFSFAQLSDQIGCDLPHTIRLCNNNLVWATKAQRVYTLTSESQYSTHNIAKISENIERDLRLTDHASAYNMDGYYALVEGRQMWMMDYSSYGYVRVASNYYIKDPETQQEWYYCELPDAADQYIFSPYLDEIRVIAKKNDTPLDPFFFVGAVNDNNDGSDAVIPLSGDTVVYPIEQAFKTKLYDFGAKERQKHIKHLFASIGCGLTGAALTANCDLYTERGFSGNRLVFNLAEHATRTEGYLQEYRILASQPRALLFGFGFTFTGRVAFGGFSITYSNTGVIR